MLATRALAPYRAADTSPGPDCQSDNEILSHVRQTGATVYNAIGTCRMGVDAGAVVGDSLRVSEIAGLRVGDASIMPTTSSANTNAATLITAEKASDILLAGE